MEPRQQGLSGGHEITPAAPGEYDFGRSPEKPANGGERYEQKSPEVGTVQAEPAQVAMPALPTPVISAPDPATALVSDDTPSVAGDDDLIEKEWVDKAKKIIADTRDDPYKREKEISKLQIEYIRKRYGREIGDSGD
jgi:hypothetical protein